MSQRMSDIGLGPPRGECKKITLSIFLLVVGLGLAAAGLDVVIRKEKNQGLALVFLGALVLIPGTYFSNKVFQACRGKQGFDSIPDI